MDLEDKLKRTNSDLFSSLEDIRKSCAEIWKDRLLPWFTNHDCTHSKEIIHISGQILDPIEGYPQFLTDHELFILLASAYLHDIGMQFLKIDGLSIDSLTETEYQTIRKKHAEASYNIILKRTQPNLTRDDFHLPNIDEEYLPAIAKVSKGHSTDYFDSVISEFQSDSATPKGRKIRGELLTALLMIADELDLRAKRADFGELAKFNPSTYSLVHWYRHHYVDFVEIRSGVVKIILRFPEGAKTYPGLVKKDLTTKLSRQIKKINPILRKTTGGLLHLEPIIEFEEKVDNTGLKRPLPEDVLREMKSLLKETTPMEIVSPSLAYCAALPKPSPIFTGRKEEIERFKRAFDTATFISIEGLGGIGKTEFAAKCIDEFVPNDRVVWLECVPDSKLDLLIDCAGYPDVLKGEFKTELAKYSGFTDLIERDRKIIFLDNFQDVIDPSFKAFFRFAERRLSKARVVLISRETPEVGVRVVPVPLEGLQKDSLQYARRLIDTYYNDVLVSDDKLKDVCDNLKGHPFAIEFAVQLLRYGETPDNIIHKIVAAKDRSEELSGKLLDEVFNHPRSTDEEREVLVHFSVYRSEVDKTAIFFLLDGRDVTEILRRLYDKKMITRSQTSNLYSTHPLIREFCYQRLLDKSITHLKAAEYFKTLERDSFEPSLEEEIFHHLFLGGGYDKAVDLVTGKGALFIRSGYTNTLGEMITKVVSKNINCPEFEVFYGDIATIRGEWQHALNHFEKAFMFPDAEGNIVAEAYIKYGEVLFRKGDVKDALKYFKDAYESSRNLYRREEARSLNDMGLVHQFIGDLESADRELRGALDIRLEVGDKEDIAASLNNIGGVLLDRDKFEEALLRAAESQKIYEDIGSRVGIALTLANIGIILRRKREIDEAFRKYLDSLKICKEIGWKEGIADALNAIGNVFIDKGKLEVAFQKYSEGLKIYEEIGSKQGIAEALDNIGTFLKRKGKYDDALQKYSEGLKIYEEIGFKQGIEICKHNIGTLLFKKKDFRSALENLLFSLSLQNQMGTQGKETRDYILQIRRTVGLKDFRVFLNSAFEAIPEDLKSFINVAEFQKEEAVHRESPKVGRNDPCPCGSGKKFKKCCGQASI